MKEFCEYLCGIPNGDRTEKEIKNYLKQMGCYLSFSWKFISAMKEMCLFILGCYEMNDLLSWACVSLQLPGHYSSFRLHLLSIHDLV